ncbi:hypothetical protein BH23CHL7_BH23CHL7_00190 [soil metagenome]
MPVIVAVVLGLYRAGEKSIWLDEAVSVSLARLPTTDLLLYLWRTELHAAPLTWPSIRGWPSATQKRWFGRCRSCSAW